MGEKCHRNRAILPNSNADRLAMIPGGPPTELFFNVYIERLDLSDQLTGGADIPVCATNATIQTARSVVLEKNEPREGHSRGSSSPNPVASIDFGTNNSVLEWGHNRRAEWTSRKLNSRSGAG